MLTPQSMGAKSQKSSPRCRSICALLVSCELLAGCGGKVKDRAVEGSTGVAGAGQWITAFGQARRFHRRKSCRNASWMRMLSDGR